MIVIGIGSQSTATVEDVDAMITDAEAEAGIACSCVATLARGAADVVVVQAAARRGYQMRLLSKTDLVARSADCVTRSQASLDAHGVHSVAEAAALAAAGQGSRLILLRLQHQRVTAAVAASADDDIMETKR